MPAERAGYTVTMFLIDVSPSMGTMRTIELPDGPGGEHRTKEITNLEWSLQFVMLKIQEMIFHGRKTDQCGVILFGTEETENIINERNGGYEHVSDYIPIGQPNAGTLSKISKLRPCTVVGDPIDAIIVGIETQNEYLASKKTWTRKMVLITDGENPMEIEDWEATAKKMNALGIITTIIGVDFDDPEFPYEEEEKSDIKRANEEFYAKFISGVEQGVVGTCAFALQECVRPEIKITKSTLSGYILRLGDVDARPEEAIEVLVKTSKCTAVVRPPTLKKFAKREASDEEDAMDVVQDEGNSNGYGNRNRDRDLDDDDKEGKTAIFAQLKMRTEYFIEPSEDDEEEDDEEDEEERARKRKVKEDTVQKVEKEALVRGFKYGSSYAPCPDGQFPRLNTRKGIDICGFFPSKNLRRDWSMGEVQYVWADVASPLQQVAFSSIVQAMYERGSAAIARWVTKDGMDPKMGVLVPVLFDKVDCFLWQQMPFADDVRRYTFASLDNLVSKKGEVVKEHPYIPTKEQLDAMDKFVDAMDLMQAGEKDEDGERQPWFDTRLSYNPAVHRTKQALFHAAIVSDLTTNPLPPPHPELVKYFDPPRKVLKRAQDAIETCKKSFKVKQVPKKVAKARKDGHVRAKDEDDEMLILDMKPSRVRKPETIRRPHSPTDSRPLPKKPEDKAKDDSETESDSDVDMLAAQKPGKPLPTPDRSVSPEIDPGRAPGRIIGTTYPLQDFRKNIERGDVVSKAVEDLAFVIKEIAMKPFASRRHNELLQCMRELRDTSLEEDEVDAWNDFLRDLRKACLPPSQPGNQAFWKEMQGVGRQMSLISNDEAAVNGGSTNVTEDEALEFIEK